MVSDPNISVGDYTIYNDFVNDPTQFEKNNVLYHYPVNGDRLVIGKYCSIACGAKFLLSSANHTLRSLSTYPFPIFYEAWGTPVSEVSSAWDNRGDIVIGNDVWIGYEAVILSGVHIGDGAIIGARAVVTRDVEPYTIMGGVPARPIRKRYDEETIQRLLALRWWDFPPEQMQLIADVQNRTDAISRAAAEEALEPLTQQPMTPAEVNHARRQHNLPLDSEAETEQPVQPKQSGESPSAGAAARTHPPGQFSPASRRWE